MSENTARKNASPLSSSLPLKSAVLLLGCCFLSSGALGEGFHVWVDDTGRKHISSIPRDGFTHRGSLRRAYNPNSLTAQHHAMRKALGEQATEIARQDAERQPQDNQPEVIAPEAEIRVPKEGIMGLRDLIKLERRGGRYSEK